MLTGKESVCGEGNRQKEEVSSYRSKGRPVAHSRLSTDIC